MVLHHLMPRACKRPPIKQQLLLCQREPRRKSHTTRLEDLRPLMRFKQPSRNPYPRLSTPGISTRPADPDPAGERPDGSCSPPAQPAHCAAIADCISQGPLRAPCGRRRGNGGRGGAGVRRGLAPGTAVRRGAARARARSFPQRAEGCRL